MAGYFGASYFHANYWHAEYWGVYLDPASGDYFGELYWHNNYWATGYWAEVVGATTTINQVATPQLAMTPYVVDIDISLEVKPATPPMTLTGFTASVANDITVTATTPAMTLFALDITYDAGETYVGDISVVVYASSNFDFTDGMNCTLETLTLTGINPSIGITSGDSIVNVTSTPAMTLSAYPTATENRVQVFPNTPSLSLTGNNVVTGFGTVANATAGSLTLSSAQTNVIGTNANINEFDATRGSLSLASFNPNVAAIDDFRRAGGAWRGVYDPYRKKHLKRREKVKEVLEEIKTIADPVDKEIAQILHQDIEFEERTAEIETLAEAIKVNYTPILAKQIKAQSPRIGKAYEKAAKEATFSAVEALEREMELAIEEDEFLLLAMTVLR